MQELQRAQAAQRRMREHVRRHKGAVRAAQNEVGNYMIALEAHRGQFVRAVAEGCNHSRGLGDPCGER